MFQLVVQWIISHFSDLVSTAAGFKTFFDLGDSFKKLLPEKLESKEMTEKHLGKSIDILDDKSLSAADKKWELDTRQSIVNSMVQLTAIEVVYRLGVVYIAMCFFNGLLRYVLAMLNRPVNK